jgi:adenine deaminase
MQDLAAMKINRTIHLLRAVGYFLAGSLLHAEPPAIFTGATLIDGTRQQPVQDATLVIQDGRIVAVRKTNADQHTKQEGAKVIYCRGKTIILSVKLAGFLNFVLPFIVKVSFHSG